MSKSKVRKSKVRKSKVRKSKVRKSKVRKSRKFGNSRKNDSKRSNKIRSNILKLAIATSLIYGGYSFMKKKPLPPPIKQSPIKPTEIIAKNEFRTAEGTPDISMCEKDEYILEDSEIFNKEQLLSKFYIDFLNKIESVTLFMNENSIEKDVNNYFFENRKEYFMKYGSHDQTGVDRVFGNFLVNKCTNEYKLKDIENCEKFFVVDSRVDPIFKQTETFNFDFKHDKQQSIEKLKKLSAEKNNINKYLKIIFMINSSKDNPVKNSKYKDEYLKLRKLYKVSIIAKNHKLYDKNFLNCNMLRSITICSQFDRDLGTYSNFGINENLKLVLFDTEMTEGYKVLDESIYNSYSL